MLFNVPDNLSLHSGIYTITNSHDNRFYIGSTICFKGRFKDHVYQLRKNKHNNKYLQAFVNKYGIDKLSFNILYPCKNTCLVYNEKTWIDELKPQFNLKKIVNRPYFDDEILFDREKFFDEMRRFNPLNNIKIDHQILSPPKCGWPKYYEDEYKTKVQKEMIIVSRPKNRKNIVLSKNPVVRKKQLNEILKQLKKDK